MFAIIGLGSSYCTGSPISVVQQEVAGKFGQYVHSAPSADIGLGSFHCSSPPPCVPFYWCDNMTSRNIDVQSFVFSDRNVINNIKQAPVSPPSYNKSC